MSIFRKLLLLACLAFAFGNVQAANVTTTTGVTCGTTVPASVTIDAGSNRWFFFTSTEDDDTPEAFITTIGTIADSEVLSSPNTSPSPDHQHKIWLWNEAAIASMTGTTVVGQDGSANDHWCYGTIEDADQTAFGAWDNTAYTAASTTLAVTTTSSAGDLILVTAVVAQSSRTFSSWDTLTEAGNTSSSARHGVATGDGGDSSSLITISSSGEISAVSLIFLNGVVAPSFDVAPTVTATTATTYTIGYTASQATTFYTVACNPGETVPVMSELKLGQCGGTTGEADANEAVTGADTTQMTGIKFPRHDIYAGLSDAGGDSAIVSLVNEDRTADANQTIVALTGGVSATSPFSLRSDSTGDPDGSTGVIVGMTDTSDFQVGMAIDITAGFSGTGPFLIDAITDTTITVDENSTSSQTNVTVTSDVYYVGAVDTNDVIEHDDTVVCASGTDAVTWAVDGDFSYTATTCGVELTTLDYCIQNIDTAVGEFTTPACWTTDDTIYIFNTAPVCESEVSGVLVLTEDQAMTAVDYSTDCADIDSHALTFTVFSGTLPTGLSLSSAGVLSGTPSVEDESGVTIRIKATDVGGLADTIDGRVIYVVNTVTMPTLTDSDLDASIADELTSFPWRATPEQTATFACDRSEAGDQVLTQDPAAASEVVHDVAITVTVANDGICLLRRRKSQ